MPSIKLSDSQKLDVSSFKTDKGEFFLNIRKFYKTKSSEDWLPTKQGLTIPVGKARKFRDAVKDEALNIEDRAVELETKGVSKKKRK